MRKIIREDRYTQYIYSYIRFVKSGRKQIKLNKTPFEFIHSDIIRSI